MIKNILVIVCLCIALGVKAQEYQLSKPLVRVEGGPLFEKQALVSAEFRLEGAALYYSLDGTVPTQSSTRYVASVAISEPGTFKIRAFKAGYMSSETVAIEFVQLGIQPKAISVTTPHRHYAGKGGQTLIDREGGSLNFKDGKSLGFDGDTIEVKIDMGEIQEIDQIIISSITASGAWIMPPHKIEAFFSKDGLRYDLANYSALRQLDAHEPTSKNYYHIDAPEEAYQYIKLTIFPLAKLPDWHSGTGNPAWVFLDEIIIKE